MSEVIVCPACQRKLRLPEGALGRPVKCPTCARTFTASAAAAPRSGSRLRPPELAVPPVASAAAGQGDADRGVPDLLLPDDSYHRTVIAFAIVGGVFVAAVAVVLFFRAVARERETLRLILLPAPVVGFVVGMIWGFAAACLLAPGSFYETPRGQAWLRRIGTRSSLVARLVCLVAVGVIGVLLLVVFFVVWL
jgi:LSD1 subclass zinc finger protein